MEEVFENLRCSREGLSSTQAEQRLAIFGPNKLEEKKVTFLYFSVSMANIVNNMFMFAPHTSV